MLLWQLCRDDCLDHMTCKLCPVCASQGTNFTSAVRFPRLRFSSLRRPRRHIRNTRRLLQVCARLVNGAKVQMETKGDNPSVTVGGLYSSGAHITSEGDVTVSVCHGRITVHTAGTAGAVTLSSVNGTAQVSTGIDDGSGYLDLRRSKHLLP